MSLESKFLSYIAIETTSDPFSNTSPSTATQFNFARFLKQELDTLHVKSILDEYSYLYAFLPANNSKKTDKIGIVCHLDTSSDAKGNDIKPNIIEFYDGNDIKLANGLIIDTATFRFLEALKGERLITTDGTTLLGGDDKAGIAIAMSIIEYFATHQHILHGDLIFAFTPDEEIGLGTAHFNYDLFKVDYAYTIDGGDIHYLSYETFNAAKAVVTCYGISVHPGSAKNKMINSTHLAIEFDNLLGSDRPESTEGREGFFHLTNILGNVEKTVSHYIIRDHDALSFALLKEKMYKIVDKINSQYKRKVLEIEISDQYHNMAEVIKNKLYIVDQIRDAFISHGINVSYEPIRGGTDGAHLTFAGIPTPNLPTGDYNAHGVLELVSVTQMEKIFEILLDFLTKKGL